MIHTKRKLTAFLVAFAAVFFIALPASAHVTVKPTSSTTEAWETYTVKIPVEKDINTNKVAIKIPETVDFKMYEPVEGWNVTTETNDDDKVTTVTWEAANDDAAIKPGEYRQFSFTAQNPAEAGDVAWDAFQYYTDGSIVEWTGDEDADLPHSVTEIAASTATTDSHGHTHEDEAETDEADAGDEDQAGSSTSTILSIAAIVISVIAIIMTFMRRK
ncbi:MULTISPECIES: DUF1775 domain-containing protein [Bacillaceae]|uniref:YcnI family copper-binding membrane protein n=1 Tax=Bacillaceae TaxID=186817 RepID=UPI001E36B0B8|nr:MULTISPECIES: DUF1775 domain-containing protein [Bacillaceae]MCE4048070.1 DUF1775 domain-containing protein [Bacillus sp. Au-Bac7]MDL0434406.1 DUF1775 domain-containing protein [Niallia sp. SS-2023]UPO89149.1 DUF1775 domain-containing protein [Niallia sp. Man26]